MGLCHEGGRRALEKKEGDPDIAGVEKGVVFALETNGMSENVLCHEE